MTLAPWRASALAMPNPMPLVDPVTRAVLFFNMGVNSVKWELKVGMGQDFVIIRYPDSIILRGLTLR